MITVLGSVNLDQAGAVPRLPRPGETVLGTAYATAPGGKGANQALAARRAGARVRMVGAVGRDAAGQAALALLDAEGVDLSEVASCQAPTGIAMILTDAQGENAIAVLPGANATLGQADADRALAPMRPGDHLLVQQEIPQDATRRALENARERGIVTMLNAAPVLPDTLSLVPLASILIANEGEFEALGGCPAGADEAARETAMRAWARTHGQTVVVTLGALGARAATPDAFHIAPALALTPSDTVGAGDTFCGYLAAGLDLGEDLSTALSRATVAAGLACLTPGAQAAIPLAEAVARARATRP